MAAAPVRSVRERCVAQRLSCLHADAPDVRLSRIAIPSPSTSPSGRLTAMAETANAAILLHRFLGVGLVLVVGGSFVARYVGIVASIEGDTAPVVAYSLSGLSVILVAVATLFIKPGVPERRPGQSVEEYWSTPQVLAKVQLVFVLVEGAGVMPAVGYVLTAEPILAIVMLVATAAFWLCGPSVVGKA